MERDSLFFLKAEKREVEGLKKLETARIKQKENKLSSYHLWKATYYHCENLLVITILDRVSE